MVYFVIVDGTFLSYLGCVGFFLNFRKRLATFCFAACQGFFNEMKRKKVTVRVEKDDGLGAASGLKSLKKDEVPTSLSFPYKWEEQLKNIMKMRESRDAPVDTLGCHMIADVLAEPKVYFSSHTTLRL